MSIDRRSFLRMLLATPAAALVDYEQLLWVPRPIVVVGALPRHLLTLEEINRITLEYLRPGIVDTFFRSSPLLAYLQQGRKPELRQGSLW